MKNGEARIKVRHANLFYLIDHFKLNDKANERAPEEQQIVLLNPEIEDML